MPALSNREQVGQAILGKKLDDEFKTLGQILNRSLRTKDYFRERGLEFDEQSGLTEEARSDAAEEAVAQ